MPVRYPAEGDLSFSKSVRVTWCCVRVGIGRFIKRFGVRPPVRIRLCSVPGQVVYTSVILSSSSRPTISS